MWYMYTLDFTVQMPKYCHFIIYVRQSMKLCVRLPIVPMAFRLDTSRNTNFQTSAETFILQSFTALKIADLFPWTFKDLQRPFEPFLLSSLLPHHQHGIVPLEWLACGASIQKQRILIFVKLYFSSSSDSTEWFKQIIPLQNFLLSFLVRLARAFRLIASTCPSPSY